MIHLVNYTKSKEKIGLVYPNIINNDAAAWVQLKKGMINVDPKRCTKIGQKIKDARWGSSHATAKWAKQGNVLSDWYRRKDCADWAFDEFLANPSSFELDEVYTWDVPQRVSINMFCARGNHFKEIVKWFLSHKTKDDEHFLSFRYHRNNKKQKDIEYAMVLNSVVVHHSFRPQKIDKHYPAYSKEDIRYYNTLSKHKRIIEREEHRENEVTSSRNIIQIVKRLFFLVYI